ncbi:hypothetical protein A2Y83_01890 [Candidatus Falkowbacteria bacterium RBG_13_39_14]|uniref:Calcium/calmodulin-dependent protein kinase II association-domain domain-containing protein n=1 Tax=Candidatus Falkowbacteria bacterium RBG_13_39_14 TaxID=1797985 RepID=A0A1F5S0Q8_9BACT|nr:MAG: hypothetical protein A2Y83_01890 [Candidatus Falkowbacteria bacterium RBG_13_39_14]
MKARFHNLAFRKAALGNAAFRIQNHHKFCASCFCLNSFIYFYFNLLIFRSKEENMYLFILVIAGCLGVAIGYMIRGKHLSQKISEEIDQKKMEEIARENFNKWIETLKGKDPKKIAKLYHQRKKSFLATFSDSLAIEREAIEEYFLKFCEKNPEGKLVKDYVEVLSSCLILHSGLYDFLVDIDGDGNKDVIEARFTFIWIFENGEWKIIHHHSSEKPKGH